MNILSCDRLLLEQPQSADIQFNLTGLMTQQVTETKVNFILKSFIMSPFCH